MPDRYFVHQQGQVFLLHVLLHQLVHHLLETALLLFQPNYLGLVYLAEMVQLPSFPDR